MAELDSTSFLGRGWAFPVGYDATGEVSMAAYEEDIRQAVRIILETRQGERLMRGDFGAGLEAFMFEPINTTTMALVRNRVEQALVLWEPRIEVLEIRVSPGDREPRDPQSDVRAWRVDRGSGWLSIEIDYRVRATNTFYNLVYPFYLLEGETR